MSILSMTFHESYGNLPTRLLSLYRRYNVSPADHDRILMALGYVWSDRNIPWGSVIDFVADSVENGRINLPYYM